MKPNSFTLLNLFVLSTHTPVLVGVVVIPDGAAAAPATGDVVGGVLVVVTVAVVLYLSLRRRLRLRLYMRVFMYAVCPSWMAPELRLRSLLP